MNVTLDFNLNFKMGFIFGILTTLFILYFNYHKKNKIKSNNQLGNIMKSNANLLTNYYLGRNTMNIHNTELQDNHIEKLKQLKDTRNINSNNLNDIYKKNSKNSNFDNFNSNNYSN